MIGYVCVLYLKEMDYMKLLIVIIFKDSAVFDALSGRICDKLSFEKNKEFPGCWDVVDNKKTLSGRFRIL